MQPILKPFGRIQPIIPQPADGSASEIRAKPHLSLRGQIRKLAFAVGRACGFTQNGANKGIENLSLCTNRRVVASLRAEYRVWACDLRETEHHQALHEARYVGSRWQMSALQKYGV